MSPLPSEGEGDRDAGGLGNGNHHLEAIAMVTGPPTLYEVLDWLEWQGLRLKPGRWVGTVAAGGGTLFSTLLLQPCSLLGDSYACKLPVVVDGGGHVVLSHHALEQK